jgi:hypothetical protein
VHVSVIGTRRALPTGASLVRRKRPGCPQLAGRIAAPFALDSGTYFRDVDGDAIAFVVQGLPTGLRSGGASIGGTPQLPGTFGIKIDATDTNGLGVRSGIRMVIGPAPDPTISMTASKMRCHWELIFQALQHHHRVEGRSMSRCVSSIVTQQVRCLT